MSKSQSSPKLEDRILEVLKAGEMHISKIREAIPDKATSVGNCLTRLQRENKIVRADRGFIAYQSRQTRRRSLKIRVERLKTQKQLTRC